MYEENCSVHRIENAPSIFQHEVKYNDSRFYNGFQLTEMIVPAEYVTLRALVSLEEDKEAIKISS